MLLFGPAGTPLQCRKRDTISGILCANSLKLRAFEMEFVRGVKMPEDMALQVKETASKLNMKLSSHAPYYINLTSKEKTIAEKSIFHIISSAKLTHLCGGWITAIHPGYYQNLSKQEAYDLVKQRLSITEEKLKAMKVKTLLGIETMGKVSTFGKLDEILSLCSELETVFPVIDFSHLRALDIFPFNKKEHFVKIFDSVENSLGKNALKQLHIHFQEVNFSEKGERSHLALGTKHEPDYRVFIDTCIEQGYSGTVISESPNIEKDALLMQAYYEKRVSP